MVTAAQYDLFLKNYDKGIYTGQRFGQAFVCVFLEGVHAELFYCESRNKAVEIIWNEYIDLGTLI